MASVHLYAKATCQILFTVRQHPRRLSWAYRKIFIKITNTMLFKLLFTLLLVSKWFFQILTCACQCTASSSNNLLNFDDAKSSKDEKILSKLLNDLNQITNHRHKPWQSPQALSYKQQQTVDSRNLTTVRDDYRDNIRRNSNNEEDDDDEAENSDMENDRDVYKNLDYFSLAKIVRRYKLHNRCSGRYLQIYLKEVNARGHFDSPLGK